MTHLTGERERELQATVIERVARLVVERRLETPAIIFLESNRPLRFIAGQGLLGLVPLIGGFIPPADLEALARVLDSEESVDLLIGRIEALAAERGGATGRRVSA